MDLSDNNLHGSIPDEFCSEVSVLADFSEWFLDEPKIKCDCCSSSHCYIWRENLLQSDDDDTQFSIASFHPPRGFDIKQPKQMKGPRTRRRAEGRNARKYSRRRKMQHIHEAAGEAVDGNNGGSNAESNSSLNSNVGPQSEPGVKQGTSNNVGPNGVQFNGIPNTGNSEPGSGPGTKQGTGKNVGPYGGDRENSGINFFSVRNHYPSCVGENIRKVEFRGLKML